MVGLVLLVPLDYVECLVGRSGCCSWCLGLMEMVVMGRCDDLSQCWGNTGWQLKHEVRGLGVKLEHLGHLLQVDLELDLLAAWSIADLTPHDQPKQKPRPWLHPEKSHFITSYFNSRPWIPVSISRQHTSGSSPRFFTPTS